MNLSPTGPGEKARFVLEQMPKTGLFAGQEWRVSPEPFKISKEITRQIESLGRIILQFYRAANLLYRQSVAGKEPRWVAEWLDLGKPSVLIEWQRSAGLKNELPRVIRPDLLLLEAGLAITELDSVPGGIGLTAWLNQSYSNEMSRGAGTGSPGPCVAVLGGAEGMLRGFESIFGDAPRVQIMVSEEAATYRPEMQWMAEQLGADRFQVRGADFREVKEGDAVYRFFELFDLANVPTAPALFDLAAEKKIRLTPPPKPLFEEKMLFALLWNRHLRGFWRRELGENFFDRLLRLVPYTWLVDPAPLPPHGALPELNLTDWHQLKALSQRDRELILKVSGFSDKAWGARGVYLGSDLSMADWTAAVDLALRSFDRNPFVLQRFSKPAAVDAAWFDFSNNQLTPMKGRVRLCPFYFVSGEGDGARANLGGMLATICPSDKKIIHGMKEAILAPCSHETD